MDKAKSISAGPPKKGSLDFEFLVREGISIAQRLSGKVWTDYNDHDPGVTLLEALAFAITDLAYRTDIPMEDLLFSGRSNERDLVDNALYAPSRIFPSSPVSANDYRKLLIDQLPEVDDAWVEPETELIYGFKGLWRVSLKLNEDQRLEDFGKVQKKAWQLLMQHRNLCEDFESVSVLNTSELSVFADIKVATDALGEYVLARVLHQLENYLNPNVHLFDQEELEDQGMDLSEVLEGPLPKRGFIRTEQLHAPATAIYVSELKELISQTEGVLSVEKITLRKDGVRVIGDEVPLESGEYLVLGRNMSGTFDQYAYPIRLLRNGLEVSVNYFQMEQVHRSIAATEKKGYGIGAGIREYRPFSSRRLESIEGYHSIQKLLPGVYGVGAYGLPEYADRKRKGQARQLKGYLLLFEQLLSSYLSHLANVRHLFSIDESEGKTYFGSFPFDSPDIDPLLKVPVGKSGRDPRASVQEQLDELTSETDPFLDRRNRFLNHLLARFGEILTDDGLRRFLLPHAGEEEVKKTLIEMKCRLLKVFPQLSEQRAKGLGYGQRVWATTNVSTLKKRLSLELNLSSPRHKLLSLGREWARKDRKTEEKEGGEKPSLNLRKILISGTHRHSYEVAADEEAGGWQLIFRFSPDSSGLVLYHADNRKDCEERLDGFIAKLKSLIKRSRGFHIIEHILLRPALKDQWRLRLTWGVNFRDAANKKQRVSIQLDSVETGRLDDMKRIGEDILIFAANRKNYVTLKSGDRYHVLVKKEDYPVLVSSETFEWATARSIMDALVKDLKSLRAKAPADLFNHLDYTREMGPTNEVDPDFYSLRLSMVMPAWVPPFSDLDFRAYFESLLRAHVPAHLAVTYHWWGLSRMRSFEPVFQLWMQEIGQEGGENLQTQQYLSSLMSQLLIGQGPDNDPDQNQEDDNSQAVAKTPRNIYRHLIDEGLYHLIYKEERLQVIEGIGPAIEHLLQRSGINTWQDLAETTKENLQNILQEAGPEYQMQDPETWPKQALLAVEGQWDELIDYQKRLIAGREVADKAQTTSKLEKLTLQFTGVEVEDHDLQAVNGIGPGMAALLKDAGIQTLTQLSSTSPQKLLDSLLEKGADLRLLQPEVWPMRALLLLNKDR